MYSLDQKQAQAAWHQAAEKVKDRVIAPTLYRAVEVGVGITLDDDVFVLGFSNADLPMAGHLRSAQHHAIILQCLSEVVKKRVRLLIVEGTALADYENYKRLKAAAEQTSTTISQRRAKERAAEQAWEEVAEQITRGYAKLNLRQIAQVKGQYINDAFAVINAAVEKLEYSDDSEEVTKRALGRVFEKLATVVEVPSAMLAYEFFKLRGEGKLA